MTRLWQILLGIDRSPGATSGGDSRLEFAAWPRGSGSIVLIVAAVAIAYLLWRLYRWEGRDLSRPRRLLLAGLRGLVLLAVAAMLLEPVWVSSLREVVPSHLAIVLDDSESMRFSDPYTDNSRAVALAADMKLESAGGKAPVERLRETPRLGLVQEVLRPGLDALERGRRLYVYDLDSAAREGTANTARSRKLDDVQPRRPISPLGDAIRGVLASHRGQPVAGIVLATDGRSNTGEDPLRAAESAARQNVPIYVIAAGADEGPRNIRLAEIEASPVVFVRDPMTLGVVVEARGLKDAEATVVLEQRVNEGGWESVGSQRVVLGEDGILKRLTFRITPKAVGQYEYRAGRGRRPRADPGRQRGDGRGAGRPPADPRAVDRRRAVAGGPVPPQRAPARPARRFLRLDAARRPRLPPAGRPSDRPAAERPRRAAPVRRRPAGGPRHAGPGPAVARDADEFRRPGRRRPDLHRRRAALAAALRVGRRALARRRVDAHPAGRPRAGAVPHRGRGPTQQPEHVHAGADPRGPRRSGLRVPRRPDPQPVDPDQPAGDVLELPGDAARPGAVVLARHGDPRMQNQYGRQVLLASQLYGPGRTVFIGFDSTYRWRYLSEDYFDGFWARLVDRVGRNKALGGRFPFQVNLGKNVYRVGDRVTVSIRYTDPAATAEASELAAELEIAGRPPEPLRFDRVPDDPGLLTAAFPAEQAGAYTLRVVPATAVDLGSGIRVSTTTFRVEPPRREVDEPSLNRSLLADLARLTGGRVLELSQAGQLDDAIPIRQVTRTIETRDELWDAPLVYATIVLALTAEWILRKVFRLI